MRYAWSCLACEEANAADQTVCRRCHCPAEATSAQIDAARSVYLRRAGLPAAAQPEPFALIASLPWLAIGAVVLLLLGGASLIVGSNASMYAFGGLLLALAAFCVSTHLNDVVVPRAH